MIKAILSVILLTYIVGCESGPERVSYRGGTSHLPLLGGRVLRYDEQHEGGLKSYQVKMEYSGGHQMKVYTVRVKDEKDLHIQFMSRDSLVFCSTNDPLTMFESLPEYRELWIDENARTGDVWQNEDTGTQTVFAGFETLEVPAGTYAKCYKTVTEGSPALFDSLTEWQDRGDITAEDYDHALHNAKLSVVRWFAPGVGLVKEQIGDETIRVLSEIVNEGKGVEDTTQALPVEIGG